MGKTPSVQKLPPVWLVKAINNFRTFLLHLNRRLFPGNVVLYEQCQNFWLLPALYVAAKLDIATLLKPGPLTAEKLSERLNADPSNIARILRALSSQGIFRQTRDGSYTLNAMSRSLLDEPGSLRYVILHHLGPVNWNLMNGLENTVITGKDAFTEKYGSGPYEYLRDHPDEYLLFDRSMTNLSDLALAPVMNAYDFTGYPVIADIGGGEGFLLANILHNNPGCRGILFDTHDALVKAPEMMARYQVEDRSQIVAGDFFHAIPIHGDLFILKNVLHNWSDEQCVELLKIINRVMENHSTLLIIDMVVPPGNKPSLSKLLDIQMMASMKGGKERTAVEFTELLGKSGFSLNRIIPTIAPLCLAEAKKMR
ncbi:MAG: methyltransferase [Bacteroidota bacterium]